MKKYLSAVLLVGLFFYGKEALAAYQIININFGVKAPTAQLEGTGTQTWNYLYESNTIPFPATGSLTDIKNSTGDVTSVDFSWGANLNYATVTRNGFKNTAYDNLMRSYTYTKKGFTSSMNFSGLEEGSYTLFVYSQSEYNGQKLNMTVSSGGLNMTETTYSSSKALNTLSEQQNYLKFETILVGADGLISMSFNGNSGTDGAGVVNGFQLVQSEGDVFANDDGSPVPEPQMIMLLGVGGAMMAYANRQRRMTANLDVPQ